MRHEVDGWFRSGTTATPDRLVLVIGGTRGTGLHIARRLHGQGFSVRVAARNPARARTMVGPMAEVVPADITRAETLPAALAGVRHVIFTAGVRSGRPSGRAKVESTEYHGVLNTLAAAASAGLAGRFLYMTSSGVRSRSTAATLLNLYKGNTLVWRARAEDAIRESGLDYTIIRAGFLLNRGAGGHALRVTQEALPLTLRFCVARDDVAEVFVTALEHPRASRTTFEVVWGSGPRAGDWADQLADLLPDALRRAP